MLASVVASMKKLSSRAKSLPVLGSGEDFFEYVLCFLFDPLFVDHSLAEFRGAVEGNDDAGDSDPENAEG